MTDAAGDAVDPGRGSVVTQAWAGVRAALAGFSWCFRSRSIAVWTGAAVLIYVTLWSVAMYVAASWDDRLVHAVMWPRGTAWWESAAYEIAKSALYFVFWLAAVVMTFVVALPIVSPVFAFVAEATENEYFQDPIAHRSSVSELLKELLHSVVRSAALVALHLSGAIAIWVFGLLAGLLFPPAATLIGVALGGGWSAAWIAMAAASYAFENNRTPARRQLALLNAKPGLLLGFGAVAQFMAWIPFFAPLTVVSATVLLCRLHDFGHVELPLRRGHQYNSAPPA